MSPFHVPINKTSFIPTGIPLSRASQTMGHDPIWGHETNGLTNQIYKFLKTLQENQK